MCEQKLIYFKWASIKYVRVRAEGGRGICSKADIVLKVNKGG